MSQQPLTPQLMQFFQQDHVEDKIHAEQLLWTHMLFELTVFMSTSLSLAQQTLFTALWLLLMLSVVFYQLMPRQSHQTERLRPEILEE